MSKTTTNQNETQTETENMLQEDQEFQETEKIDEVEKVSEEVSASAKDSEDGETKIEAKSQENTEDMEAAPYPNTVGALGWATVATDSAEELLLETNIHSETKAKKRQFISS